MYSLIFSMLVIPFVAIMVGVYLADKGKRALGIQIFGGGCFIMMAYPILVNEVFLSYFIPDLMMWRGEWVLAKTLLSNLEWFDKALFGIWMLITSAFFAMLLCPLWPKELRKELAI